MLLKYQDPVDLEIYKWIAINKTDFQFATKIFNLLGNVYISLLNTKHTV